MKYIVIILAGLISLMACNGVELYKPPEPICNTLEDSWICEQSHKMNVEPENVYGWVYSAVAIAGIRDTDNLKTVCDFEQEVKDWYVENAPITYDTFIDEIIERSGLFDDPVKIMLIRGIINKNIIYYRSPELIKPDDETLLSMGHEAFRRDLCF